MRSASVHSLVIRYYFSGLNKSSNKYKKRNIHCKRSFWDGLNSWCEFPVACYTDLHLRVPACSKHAWPAWVQRFRTINVNDSETLRSSLTTYPLLESWIYNLSNDITLLENWIYNVSNDINLLQQAIDYLFKICIRMCTCWQILFNSPVLPQLNWNIGPKLSI